MQGFGSPFSIRNLETEPMEEEEEMSVEGQVSPFNPVVTPLDQTRFINRVKQYGLKTGKFSDEEDQEINKFMYKVIRPDLMNAFSGNTYKNCRDQLRRTLDRDNHKWITKALVRQQEAAAEAASASPAVRRRRSRSPREINKQAEIQASAIVAQQALAALPVAQQQIIQQAVTRAKGKGKGKGRGRPRKSSYSSSSGGAGGGGGGASETESETEAQAHVAAQQATACSQMIANIYFYLQTNIVDKYSNPTMDLLIPRLEVLESIQILQNQIQNLALQNNIPLNIPMNVAFQPAAIEQQQQPIFGGNISPFAQQSPFGDGGEQQQQEVEMETEELPGPYIEGKSPPIGKGKGKGKGKGRGRQQVRIQESPIEIPGPYEGESGSEASESVASEATTAVTEGSEPMPINPNLPPAPSSSSALSSLGSSPAASEVAQMFGGPPGVTSPLKRKATSPPKGTPQAKRRSRSESPIVVASRAQQQLLGPPRSRSTSPIGRRTRAARRQKSPLVIIPPSQTSLSSSPSLKSPRKRVAFSPSQVQGTFAKQAAKRGARVPSTGGKQPRSKSSVRRAQSASPAASRRASPIAATAPGFVFGGGGGELTLSEINTAFQPKKPFISTPTSSRAPSPSPITRRRPSSSEEEEEIEIMGGGTLRPPPPLAGQEEEEFRLPTPLMSEEELVRTLGI